MNMVDVDLTATTGKKRCMAHLFESTNPSFLGGMGAPPSGRPLWNHERWCLSLGVELDVDTGTERFMPKHSHLPNLGNPRELAHNSPWLVNEHNLLSPHVRNTCII